MKFKISQPKQGDLAITGQGVSLAFDAKTGFLKQYSVNGTNLLGAGGVLKPNFWRAVTDNDMGAWLQQKLQVWRNPVMNLTSLGVDKKASSKSQVAVVARYDMPEVHATLTLTYEIHRGGAMCVTQGIAFDESYIPMPEMLRFGMVMELPYLMEKKPIIAATDPNCDMGSIAEQNGYGYWCSSNDVSAFTQCVDKMLVSDMAQMGENGYQFYLNNYTVEHTYNAIMKHF